MTDEKHPLPEPDDRKERQERQEREDRAERLSREQQIIEEPEDALPEITVEELPQTLKDAIGRMGWAGMTPVQSRAVPYMLARQDIMVQARTGSGKTGAFILPMLERLNPNKNSCQALVLTPTRELAKQVADEAEALSGGTIRIVPVYGGVGYGTQIEAFNKGAHIVVGTPGRILDHLMRRSLLLDDLKILVFDEADRMLSIGFYPDMKDVQRFLPDDIDAYMFSATFPQQVLRLADEFLSEPKFLSLSAGNVNVAEIEHTYYEVPGMGKERALVRIIEALNPTSAIIFCNTKSNVHFVTAVLQQFGYDADELSADLSQNKREQVLGRLRAGELRFLVATDVAARGLDVRDLSHVFLYEPPEDKESYIHRAGRTGRAGAAGTVVSLVDVIQKMELQRIGNQFSVPLVRKDLPSDEDIQEIVGTRLHALLTSRLRKTGPLVKERIRRFLPMATSLSCGEDEEGPALLAMLLDELYQQTLHGPPPVPTTVEVRGRKPRPSRRDSGSKRPSPARRSDQPPAKDAAPAQQGGERGGQQAEGGEEGAPPKRRRRPRRKKTPGEGGSGA